MHHLELVYNSYFIIPIALAFQQLPQSKTKLTENHAISRNLILLN